MNIKTLLNIPDYGNDTDKFYDFGKIGRYFNNIVTRKQFYHVISDSTANDLDIEDLFIRIDRTTSCIGQQYLYSKIRTFDSEDKLSRFDSLAEAFTGDSELKNRCSKYLSKIRHKNGYYFEELFHGEHIKLKGIYIYYALAAAFIILLALSFLYPALLIFLLPIYIVNYAIHYRNKRNLNYYLTGVSEFSKSIKVGKRLAGEERLKDFFPERKFLDDVSKIKLKTEFISFESRNDNELASVLLIFVELIKVAFNIEVILFYKFIYEIIDKRESLDQLFCFIGEVDSAISVSQIRAETPQWCKPQFEKSKIIVIEDIVHPLIDGCVPNDLELNNKSILLTGSNMSGKTTFIRTISLNAILAQTLNTCFARVYRAPYFRIFSSIRLSDDLAENTSYYLEEVLTIKDFLSESRKDGFCLFVLDEIFKGTNTTERIAAGKGVLSYLSGDKNLVIVSTHDIELAELLENDGYRLYHFCENIEDSRLVFDYTIREGKLKTKNAIRILELYGYPQEIIADAEKVKQIIS